MLSQGTLFPQPQASDRHPTDIAPHQGPEHPWLFAEIPIGCPQETLPCASPRPSPPRAHPQGAVRSPYRLCSSSCSKKTPSGTGSPPWGEEEGTAVSGEGTLTAGWAAIASRCPTQLANRPQGHSLGHLGDVFVAQSDPQVIILIQENLLNPGFPDTARLVPGKRAGSVTVEMGLGGGTLSPCCLGSRDRGGRGGSSWLCQQRGEVISAYFTSRLLVPL